MLRINLLPVRASRKQETARQELMVGAALAVVVIGCLYAWNASVSSDIQDTETQIAEVKSEIKRLKQDVVRVEDFKKKAATLESKIAAIQRLQDMRVGPAKMLDDLARILTDEKRVWLTSLVEKGGKVTMKGHAMDHENIADFQLALARQSKFFTNVRLALVQTTKKDGEDLLEWTMSSTANYAPGK